jgi:[histone H3]-lysine36 N-trimethyltransferase
MADSDSDIGEGRLEPELGGLHLEDGTSSAEIAATSRTSFFHRETNATLNNDGPTMPLKEESPDNNVFSNGTSNPPTLDAPKHEEILGGEITLKVEPGKVPKLSRSHAQKVIAKPPELFSHLADSTEEAFKTFDVIEECSYVPKYMGETEAALECDCAEEWGKS